jgi:hypothetical protein
LLATKCTFPRMEVRIKPGRVQASTAIWEPLFQACDGGWHEMALITPISGCLSALHFWANDEGHTGDY